MNSTAFLTRYGIFTTRQFAVLCGKNMDSASRTLGRLAKQQGIVRVTRGLWAQPEYPGFTPAAAVSFLLGNEQGYVSFLSAMHRHDLVSQIPGCIQVATTGHTRTLRTAIARFEFLRIKPEMMMTGIVSSETTPPYAISSPEKALLDTLYIATRKSKRFASLPELDLTHIDSKTLFDLLNQQITSQPLRQAVLARLAQLGMQGNPLATVAAAGS